MQSRLFGFVVSTENEKTALGRRRGKTHSLMIFFPIGLSIFFFLFVYSLFGFRMSCFGRLLMGFSHTTFVRSILGIYPFSFVCGGVPSDE